MHSTWKDAAMGGVAGIVALIMWAAKREEVRYTLRYLWFLSGISGAFWLLSHIFGHFALAVHEALIEEFAALFAAIYNIVLAVLFSSIIFLSTVVAGSSSPYYFWFEGGGFVFLYVILSAAYMDPISGELGETSYLGFWAGLLAYLGFAIFPGYLVNPATIKVYTATRWIAGSWIGRAVSLYALLKLLVFLFHSARNMLTFHPKIRVRR